MRRSRRGAASWLAAHSLIICFLIKSRTFMFLLIGSRDEELLIALFQGAAVCMVKADSKLFERLRLRDC